MRTLLIALLLSVPLGMTAQAPACEPKRPLVIDTSRVVLGVRVFLIGDSLPDSTLTQRLGRAMTAIPFRVPGTVSRVFYPGTGRGPAKSTATEPSTRLLGRVTIESQVPDMPPWRIEIETASEDPVTDTAFVAALHDAMPWVRPIEADSVRAPWHVELVVATPGDTTVHPLARLTIPTVRLDKPAKLRKGPMQLVPRSQVQRGEGGVVRVQYVVDEGGRVEPFSLRILSTPSLSFAASARAIVFSSKFDPAIAGGCPQKQLVVQSVRFPFGLNALRPR